MKDVIVVIGPGQIGQAIARRVGAGRHLMLADKSQDNATAAAGTLSNVGYEVSVSTVDVSSREAVRRLVETAIGRGEVTGLIHAAGVSPTRASPETILKVDLYGTALVLQEFGNIIAPGEAGVVSPRSLDIAFRRLASNKIGHWPRHPLPNCSVFPSFSRTR